MSGQRDAARDSKLCHELIMRLKDEGLDPEDTVYILFASAATVSLLASNSERTDFEAFAGEVFTQFAKASNDVRGRR